MRLVIIRTSYLPFATFGVAHLMEGNQEMYRTNTLELAWRDNNRNRSCIPEGEYPIDVIKHQQYGKVLALRLVPKRSGILIHAFNTPKESKGCIAFGSGIDKSESGPVIADSQKSLNDAIGILEKAKVKTLQLKIIKV